MVNAKTTRRDWPVIRVEELLSHHEEVRHPWGSRQAASARAMPSKHRPPFLAFSPTHKQRSFFFLPSSSSTPSTVPSFLQLYHNPLNNKSSSNSNSLNHPTDSPSSFLNPLLSVNPLQNPPP